MEIQEKTNVTLYLQDYIDDSFILTFYDILEPDWDRDGYLYILPKTKAFFKFVHQGQQIIAYVEKIDENKKRVYVSQSHWVFMKNLIKSELGLDVKIKKRYAGKLTVAELVNPNQRVDKALTL